MLSPLTTDLEQIAAALRTALPSQAQARSQDLERTLARLEALTQALGTVPGSKALFFTPDHAPEGRIHGLGVELRRDGTLGCVS